MSIDDSEFGAHVQTDREWLRLSALLGRERALDAELSRHALERFEIRQGPKRRKGRENHR
jgi:hypothetical protein